MQEEERWGVPPCQQTSPPLDSIDLIIADLRSTIIYSCTVPRTTLQTFKKINRSHVLPRHVL